MSNLLTVTEVADKLKVTERLAYSYIKSGLLPAVRISGRTVRVKEESLTALINSQDEYQHLTVKAALFHAGVSDPLLPQVYATAKWLRAKDVRETKRRGVKGFLINSEVMAELKEYANS